MTMLGKRLRAASWAITAATVLLISHPALAQDPPDPKPAGESNAATVVSVTPVKWEDPSKEKSNGGAEKYVIQFSNGDHQLVVVLPNSATFVSMIEQKDHISITNGVAVGKTIYVDPRGEPYRGALVEATLPAVEGQGLTPNAGGSTPQVGSSDAPAITAVRSTGNGDEFTITLRNGRQLTVKPAVKGTPATVHPSTVPPSPPAASTNKVDYRPFVDTKLTLEETIQSIEERFKEQPAKPTDNPPGPKEGAKETHPSPKPGTQTPPNGGSPNSAAPKSGSTGSGPKRASAPEKKAALEAAAEPKAPLKSGKGEPKPANLPPSGAKSELDLGTQKAGAQKPATPSHGQPAINSWTINTQHGSLAKAPAMPPEQHAMTISSRLGPPTITMSRTAVQPSKR